MIDLRPKAGVLRTIMHQVNASRCRCRSATRCSPAEFSGRGDYDYSPRGSLQALCKRDFKLARNLTVEHITANLARAVEVYAKALHKHEK